MTRPLPRLLLTLALIAVFAFLLGRAVDVEHAQAHGVSVWTRLADCETGDGDGRWRYRADWDYNGSSGFDGGLQFHPGTWAVARRLPEVRWDARRYPFAYQAPASIQIAVARAWLARTSWAQWPDCSRKLGLR